MPSPGAKVCLTIDEELRPKCLVGALVAVGSASERMKTLSMVLLNGALERWRYRQIFLLGAGLGVLLKYRWQSRAQLAEERLKLSEAPMYTVENVSADLVARRWWAHWTRWRR